jgi:hypothetical protein
MRARLTAVTVCTAAATAIGWAQEPKPKSSGKNLITVTGCIDRSYLDVREQDTAGFSVERYRLKGPKDLLKEISAKYNRHLVEITGAVTDTASTTHMGKTVQVGKKTRITTAAKDVPQTPSAETPTLEVATYRELQDSCKG